MIFAYLLCPQGHEHYESTAGELRVPDESPNVTAKFSAICPTCGELYFETRTGSLYTKLDRKGSARKGSASRGRT